MINKLFGKLAAPLFTIVFLGSIYSCNSYEEVNVTDIKSIKLLEFSSEGLRVESQVKIDNPNNYNISVTDSKFNVYSKNTLIGSSKIENKVNLKKNSEDYHTIIFNSAYKDLAPNAASTLLTLTAMSGEQVNFRVDGFIEARSFMLKKKFPVSFEDNVPLDFY